MLFRSKKYGKRVVLVIEDMDRLDPAHLFRIMNVFSAHMDYGYRSMQPIDSSLVGNKFGVSNVVFVMHEKNTEALFHHFYGDDPQIAASHHQQEYNYRQTLA